jgi:hypothetical protein
MFGRRLLTLLIPVAALMFAADANAGPRVVVGIGGPPVVYYHPYHSSFRFYFGPAPVFVAPAPVVVIPATPPPTYVVVPAQPASPVYVPAPAPAAPTLPPPPPATIPTVPVNPPGK